MKGSTRKRGAKPARQRKVLARPVPHAIALALAILGPAKAAEAACDNLEPESGQTATCTSAPPNPDTQAVQAVAGSTGVTVEVQAGAGLAVTGEDAVLVRSQSSASNAGSIQTTGDSAFAMRIAGDGSTLVNTGTLATSGASAHGMAANGEGNRIDNQGTITTTGTLADAINVRGNDVMVVVTNSGIAHARGYEAEGVLALGPIALTNTATGQILSDQNHGVFANEGGTIDNAGLIRSDEAAIVVNLAAATLTNSGTIESLDGYGVSANAGGSLDITNTGTIAGPRRAIDLSEGNDAVHMLGGVLRGEVVLRGGDDSFDMSAGLADSLDLGTGRDNFTLTGGHMQGAVTNADVVNVSGGRAGSIGLDTSDGIVTMSDGQVDGDVTGQGGNDRFAQSGGTIGGTVSLGEGNNTLTLSGGSIGAGIVTGAGSDAVQMLDGTVRGAIATGAGDDSFAMSAGVADSLDLGTGRDTFTLTGGRMQSAVTNADVVTIVGGRVGTVGLDIGDGVVTMSDGQVDGGITGQAGNDRFAQSGGTIGGTVNLGEGNNALTLSGGSIGAGIVTGAGSDSVQMLGGTVHGAIVTGAGDDLFAMSAGVADSLDLGAGRDTFTLTGGHLQGAVSNADIVTIGGGRVGSVGLDSGDGSVAMSNGQVDGDITGQRGNDRFTLSGGTIGGTVNLGDGNNAVDLGGGNVGGGIVTGAGDDQLRWHGPAQVSTVALGSGNDSATLTGLDDPAIATLNRLDGGAGTDTLTLDRSDLGSKGRFIGFESVNLDNASRLTLDTDLALGDARSPTLRPSEAGPVAGTLNIDATSTLNVPASAAVLAAAPGQRVAVSNAGTIDLTQGPAVGAQLTVAGNYTGQDGRLLTRAVLGADDSPSDRLIVSQGTVSGSTMLVLTPIGGAGALTRGDGIPLVLVSGGSSAPGAFALHGGSLKAGPYTYLLYRGGTSAGSEESWFLRSSVPGANELTPDGASTPPEAAPGSPAVPTSGTRPDTIPLYRAEVPLYAAAPAVARELLTAQIGTFHDRQGNGLLLREQGPSASWGRAWGGYSRQGQAGTAGSAFHGSMTGMQAGQDLYASESASGQRDHVGAYVAYGHASGDVSGTVLGFAGTRAGSLAVDAWSGGAYWTHIGPGGWYTDTVLQGTSLTASPRSDMVTNATTHGHAIAASFETGVPLAVGANVTVEPQVQVVWQRLRLNDLQDPVSSVAFRNADGALARAGVRVQKAIEHNGTQWRPFLRVDVLRAFGGSDQTIYDGSVAIPTSLASTSARVQAGVTGTAGKHGSVYGTAGYVTSLDGAPRNDWMLNLGVRWRW